MSYKCEDCKNNNNGWCKIKKINGLKKANIKDCSNYSSIDGTTMIMEDNGIDAFGQRLVAITINGELINLPLVVLKAFVNDPENTLEINIPG